MTSTDKTMVKCLIRKNDVRRLAQIIKSARNSADSICSGFSTCQGLDISQYDEDSIPMCRA